MQASSERFYNYSKLLSGELILYYIKANLGENNGFDKGYEIYSEYWIQSTQLNNFGAL